MEWAAISPRIGGSLLFLLVTFYLDARSGEQINRIVEATGASEEILRARERQIDSVIEPVRDPETGQPRKYETEMETLWVVKVVAPACWDVLTPEQRAEYDTSPVREGEFYFCNFFNGSWHMSRGTMVDDPLRFYLSGKVGPATWGENANAFMARFEDPFKDLKRLTTLLLDFRDGTPKKRGGRGG